MAVICVVADNVVRGIATGRGCLIANCMARIPELRPIGPSAGPYGRSASAANYTWAVGSAVEKELRRGSSEVE